MSQPQMKLKEVKPRKTRRGNNEGSIYKRKDGRWVCEVTVGYKSNGKPIREPYYGKTRNEAARKAADKIAEVNKVGYITLSASTDRNFKKRFHEWFGLYGTSKMSSRTEYNRRTVIGKHLYSVFGSSEVQDMTTDKLQTYFKEKVDNGLHPDTVSILKGLLKRFFTYTCKCGLTKENPMLDVSIHKPKAVVSDDNDSDFDDDGDGDDDYDYNYSDDDEVTDDDDVEDDGNDAYEVVKALSPATRTKIFKFIWEHFLLRPILLLAVLTGMRPQELLALEKKHVFLKKKYILIENGVTRHYDFDEDGNALSSKSIIGPTKTKKSRRKLKITDYTVSVIEEWDEYCKSEGIKSKYVFPNLRTGKHRSYESLRHMFERFLAKNEIKVKGLTLYSFRHTFGAILVEQKVAPRAAADLFGHEKPELFLNRYGHAFEEVHDDTAQRVSDAVTSFLPQSNA